MPYLNQHELESELSHWLMSWPDGLIALDAQNKIIWFSPLASDVLGWRVEDISTQSPHNILCVDSRLHQHQEHDCPLIYGNDSNAVHSTVWQNKNGFNTYVDFRVIPVKQGAHTHRIISFRDTQQDEHDRAELDKLSAYVDNNPSPIAEFDAQGQLLFSNPALQERLLDFGFDEFGNARIFPEKLNAICEEILQSDTLMTNAEVNLDQEWYAWRFHVLEIEHDGKPIRSIMAYGIDITNQKRAEEDARRERANARRDFYAKMMHELRTPLNAIVGFSELLLARSKSKLDKRDIRSLDTIKTAGLQLGDLITDTLDIAKIEAGKMTLSIKQFDVKSVADDIHHQMLSLAEAKQLAYEVHIDQISTMRSDKTKLRQLLINLISNGIKYTKQGSVYLNINQVSIEDKDWLKIEVKDTGLGIPSDQLNDLFGAYERINRKDELEIQGTGLGLALVKEIVSMMGGDISVESEEGKGSSFTTMLPLLLQKNSPSTD